MKQLTLTYMGPLQVVQAFVLHMGQQSPMPSMSVTDHCTRQDAAYARGKRLRCSTGGTVSMLRPKLRCLRAIPAVCRRVAPAPNTERPCWRMGQLLQYAVPRRRWPNQMGMERRGPRLDRGLFRTPATMGPRRRLRGSVGQPPPIHRRLGQEDVLLRSVFH